MSTIKWEATKREHELIREIVKRAGEISTAHTLDFNPLDFSMDIEAVHCNGCRLDLESILKASDSDFGHDIFGIRRYIDRDTGKLTDCFVPRCAAREGGKER
jgi:hypothetical protein